MRSTNHLAPRYAISTYMKINHQIVRIKTQTRKLSMLERTTKSFSEVVCSSVTNFEFSSMIYDQWPNLNMSFVKIWQSPKCTVKPDTRFSPTGGNSTSFQSRICCVCKLILYRWLTQHMGAPVPWPLHHMTFAFIVEFVGVC